MSKTKQQKQIVEIKKQGRRPHDKSDNKINQQSNMDDHAETKIKKAVSDADWNAYL